MEQLHPIGCLLFLFQNLTLGYITKTLIRLFFFTPPKSEYFFQSNIGNQNILLEKKHNPPPFKLNGHSLTISFQKWIQ
jgi:hypothetical protein